MTDRDRILLFVDALNRFNNAWVPILIPDLRAQILEVARRGVEVGSLANSRPTTLFHLLRQLVEHDLLQRQPRGYVVTNRGQARAQEIRAEAVNEIDKINDAAASALARVA